MKTDHPSEFTAENLAIANDIALLITAASALYDEFQLDVASGYTSLLPSQRQSVCLKLRTLNEQILRGLEYLKDQIDYDLYMTQEWTRRQNCEKEKMSLANALGHTKRGISSNFYTDTAFNL